ncbi:IS66 family insertion sequence element accessory protein TnpB [Pandoraea oxalativorans]|nr:IS66 family insertion sequence element accessory protein TnpB [Pandoraea oxalativorans]
MWIAAGVTDRRCGFNGRAAKLEAVRQQDPFSRPIFLFRRRRGDLVKE